MASISESLTKFSNVTMGGDVDRTFGEYCRAQTCYSSGDFTRKQTRTSAHRSTNPSNVEVMSPEFKAGDEDMLSVPRSQRTYDAERCGSQPRRLITVRARACACRH